MAVPWSLVIENLLCEARLRWNKVPHLVPTSEEQREGSLHINPHHSSIIPESSVPDTR